MNLNTFPISKNRMEILLGLSLIPLMVKSISYLLIGSLIPLLVFLLFGGLLFFAFSSETRYQSLIIKAWSIGIILWGLSRIALMILFLMTSVDEAHVRSQFGIWFIVLSAFYITTGVYFFKTVKKQK